MDNFTKRSEPGVKFEKWLKEQLEESPRIKKVEKTGTEHTHPEFVELLRSNESNAAIFVRFAPDGVYLTDKDNVVHYDAKYGKSIEKNAYETYLKYKNAGCTVVLFVAFGGIVYWQHIENVRLIPGQETVKKYPPEKRWPVRKDEWIYPRDKAGFQSTDRFSGTPYREIDFDSMKKWKEYV